MIGAGKPESRSCPVVLDPTVAASFVGLIGGVLGADAVQRGRSPFAERLGDRGRRRGAHPPRRRPRPRRARRPRPSTARASRSAPHGADRGRHPAHLPLRHLHGQARRRRVDRQRRPRRLPQPAAGLGLEPGRRRPGPSRFEELLGEAGRGRLRHRRRRPALGRQPGHRRLLGRRLGSRDPRRRAGRAACASSRSPATWSRCSAPCGRPGAEARWVPFGGSVSTPPLLIGEMTVAGA